MMTRRGWATDWFAFVERLGVKTEPDMVWEEDLDSTVVQQWIDQAVIAFAGKSVRAVRSYGEAVGRLR